VPGFFDKTFEEQGKEIIKTGDLKLLQAFIGIRNPIALLQYCASFLITKINIMHAQCQAENRIAKASLEYYLDGINRTGSIPQNITQHSSATLKKVISDGKDDLQNNKVLLPTAQNKCKFLIGNKSSELKNYISETNIGSLCVINVNQINEIYENFVKNSKIEEVLKLNLKDDLSIMKVRLKSDIEALDTKLRIFNEKLKGYNNSLNEIKEGVFLNQWYKGLLDEILEEAESNKKHLLHGKVSNYKEVNCGNLGLSVKNLIIEDIRSVWNRELVSRAFKEIAKNAIIVNENDYAEAVEELLKRVNLTSEDVLSSVSKKFKGQKERKNYCSNSQLKSKEEVIGYIIENFSPSCLVKAEQDILNEMLLHEVKSEKNDAVSLLICNGANYKELDFMLSEEIAFLEIKRLYKDMPIIGLPMLSLEEIKAVFPNENRLSQVASCILKQKEELENRKININQVLSEEYPWYLCFYYLRNIPAKINLRRVEKASAVVENLSKSFEESVGCESSKPFFGELKKIKKGEGYFSLNKEIFRELQKMSNDESNVLSFKELAEQVVDSKTEYIRNKQEEEKIQKATAQSKQVAVELNAKSMNDQIEKNELKQERDISKAKAETAEAKAETLADIIARFQRGELPESALRSVDVSQFLPSTSKQK
jgi:hypothetical protein